MTSGLNVGAGRAFSEHRLNGIARHQMDKKKHY
jgi:hypothetical protein